MQCRPHNFRRMPDERLRGIPEVDERWNALRVIVEAVDRALVKQPTIVYIHYARGIKIRKMAGQKTLPKPSVAKNGVQEIHKGP